MKRFRTADGEPLTGMTSRDIIKALRAMSRDPEPTLQAFMESTAARVTKQNGAVIPTASEADFITGLVAAGLLIEENETE